MEVISDDERRCLRQWFKSAIAELELREATERMLKRDREDEPIGRGRHFTFAGRRINRAVQGRSHGKELLHS